MTMHWELKGISRGGGLVIECEISGSFDNYISPWKWSQWNFGFIKINQQKQLNTPRDVEELKLWEIPESRPDNFWGHL